MVWVDGRDVRSKARKSYQRAVKELEKAKRDWSRFQELDKPQFQEWLHRNFGPLLTEMRDLQQRLDAKSMLLCEVEMEWLRNGGSMAAAYRRVVDRQEEDGDEDDPFGEANSSKDRGRQGQDAGEGEEPFGDEDDFGSFSDRFRRWREQEFGGAAAKGKSGAEGRRLKELYRMLVRLLHPDTQAGKMSSKKQEWWHQVQDAYEKGNLETMEIILALYEMEEEGDRQTQSVSILIRVTAHLRASLRSLRAQIRRCRSDPAWSFSTRRDRHLLALDLELQLETEREEMTYQLRQLERRLAQISRGRGVRQPVWDFF